LKELDQNENEKEVGETAGAMAQPEAVQQPWKPGGIGVEIILGSWQWIQTLRSPKAG